MIRFASSGEVAPYAYRLNQTSANATGRRPTWSRRRRGLTREIVNQPVRIADVAARKFGLVLDDLTAALNQSHFRRLDIADFHFQHGTERRAALDEEIDVRPMQAHEVGRFIGNREAQLAHVEERRFLGVLRLDEDVGLETTGHARPR